jgi:acetyl esterase/lipase
MRDVAFLPDGRKERLDLWLPNPSVFTGPRPAVVLIHGGGWAKGDKDEPRQRETAGWLASEGYAVLSINYKLTQFSGDPLKSPPVRTCWPECLHDCRNALRMAQENSRKWNVNPTRVSLLGFSAGAHLALLTAITSGHPKLDRYHGKFVPSCVLGFYGIYDLDSLGARWRFGEPAQHPAKVRLQASPVCHLHPEIPPVFLAHGESDKTVPIQQTLLLASGLAQFKIPHEVVLLPRAPHGFRVTSDFGDLRPAVRAFLQAYSQASVHRRVANPASELPVGHRRASGPNTYDRAERNKKGHRSRPPKRLP